MLMVTGNFLGCIKKHVFESDVLKWSRIYSDDSYDDPTSFGLRRISSFLRIGSMCN